VIRAIDSQDTRFLRDMLRHAYHWRIAEDPDRPLYRYVQNWGRPGDAGVIAFAGPNAYGAAWYRLFPASAAGFGFVDEETPELTIAVVPSCRGRGYGDQLLSALMDRARADGYERVSLSVEPDSPAVHLYKRHGFETVAERGGASVMVADL